MTLNPFQQAILKEVRNVPAGKVASYGQIAAYIGSPRAARQVGGAMRAMEGTPDFPWWRIINNAGIITIKGAAVANKRMQKELLEAEGIEVSADYTIDMARYRYHPDNSDVEWQDANDNLRLL
jgi:methylated-DNA-protein-cysteine methyltransferase related protein